MKKVMLFLLLCAASFLTKAQTADNSLGCDVNVATVCYSNSLCTVVSAIGAVTVMANSTNTALATGTCPTGSSIGYLVCCSPSTPPSPGCTRINDGGTLICSSWGTTGQFACCGLANNVVNWVGSVMKIH